jgi:hypothetical protein
LSHLLENHFSQLLNAVFAPFLLFSDAINTEHRRITDCDKSDHELKEDFKD